MLPDNKLTTMFLFKKSDLPMAKAILLGLIISLSKFILPLNLS